MFFPLCSYGLFPHFRQACLHAFSLRPPLADYTTSVELSPLFAVIYVSAEQLPPF